MSPDAREVPVEDLPTETLRFLMASRFCEVDLLSPLAVELVRRRAARVGAGGGHLRLGPHEGDLQLPARPADPDRARRLHRADRRLPGLPAPGHHVLPLPQHPGAVRHGLSGRHRRAALSDSPMDFSAWFEVYLEDRWWTFDARHNVPRIGRVLIATGLDATDVAITTSFGRREAVALRGGDRRDWLTPGCDRRAAGRLPQDRRGQLDIF